MEEYEDFEDWKTDSIAKRNKAEALLKKLTEQLKDLRSYDLTQVIGNKPIFLFEEVITQMYSFVSDYLGDQDPKINNMRTELKKKIDGYRRPHNIDLVILPEDKDIRRIFRFGKLNSMDDQELEDLEQKIINGQVSSEEIFGLDFLEMNEEDYLTMTREIYDGRNPTVEETVILIKKELGFEKNPNITKAQLYIPSNTFITAIGKFLANELSNNPALYFKEITDELGIDIHGLGITINPPQDRVIYYKKGNCITEEQFQALSAEEKEKYETDFVFGPTINALADKLILRAIEQDRTLSDLGCNMYEILKAYFASIPGKYDLILKSKMKDVNEHTTIRELAEYDIQLFNTAINHCINEEGEPILETSRLLSDWESADREFLKDVDPELARKIKVADTWLLYYKRLRKLEKPEFSGRFKPKEIETIRFQLMIDETIKAQEEFEQQAELIRQAIAQYQPLIDYFGPFATKFGKPIDFLKKRLGDFINLVREEPYKTTCSEVSIHDPINIALTQETYEELRNYFMARLDIIPIAQEWVKKHKTLLPPTEPFIEQQLINLGTDHGDCSWCEMLSFISNMIFNLQVDPHYYDKFIGEAT